MGSTGEAAAITVGRASKSDRQLVLKARSCFESVDQDHKAFTAVLCVKLLNHSPLLVHYGDAVSLYSPVDPDEVFQ